MSIGGPYFEDLAVGDRWEDAPAMTLTEGAAALHQAILGDRLRLPLDRELAARVAGAERGLAHPGLVWDISIGQSTPVTQRVIANVFYRGLVLRRIPQIGDTLRTTTEVVALRETRSRPAGLAALRIHTVDQEARAVLDYVRCAMLPTRPGAEPTGHAADLEEVGRKVSDVELRMATADWNLAMLAAEPGHRPPPRAGPELLLEGGDVVSSASELARLSLNVAMAHHDEAAGSGRRLVYGGHTIGIAAAQASRALPGLTMICGWHSCDHTGPVYEGDTLRSRITIERRDGELLHLRSLVEADRTGLDEPVPALDWRFVGVYS